MSDFDTKISELNKFADKIDTTFIPCGYVEVCKYQGEDEDNDPDKRYMLRVDEDGIKYITELPEICHKYITTKPVSFDIVNKLDDIVAHSEYTRTVAVATWGNGVSTGVIFTLICFIVLTMIKQLLSGTLPGYGVISIELGATIALLVLLRCLLKSTKRIRE
jgi:uncharacterized membrane protein